MASAKPVSGALSTLLFLHDNIGYVAMYLSIAFYLGIITEPIFNQA